MYPPPPPPPSLFCFFSTFVPISSSIALHRTCTDGTPEHLVTTLVAQGADVNYVNEDEDGSSCIGIAAKRGHTACVVRLLDNGADVNKTGADGKTPVYIATYYGKIETLGALLVARQGSLPADVNRTDIGTKKKIDFFSFF